MPWDSARFGAILTRNKDNTEKAAPKFWTPERAIFAIPPEGSDHARPFLMLQSENQDDVVAMKIYQHEIVAQVRGRNIKLLDLRGDHRS